MSRITIAPLIAISTLIPLASTLAACADDFDPPSVIDSLRVLAMRAEPANPPYQGSTTIEPLVYTPSDAATVTYAWSWCPVLGSSGDGYVCPITDAELAQLAAQLGLSEPPPPLTLGTDPTQEYANVFPPEVLASVCEDGFAGVRPDCEDGFPIRVNVTVAVATTGESLKATMILRLPIDADTPSNQNPQPSGVVATIDGSETPMDGSGAVTIPRRVDTQVRALLDAAASESYEGVDEDGNPATLRENLHLSWFVESGKIDELQTSYLAGVTDLDDALLNTWEPADRDDYPAGTARLIVVVRDDRGGVGWTSGLVSLAEEETP